MPSNANPVAARSEQSPEPPAGFHGMLVLGSGENIYFLHLAMRSPSPHQFQLIMKTRLVDDGGMAVGDREFVGDLDATEGMTAEDLYFADRTHVDNDVAVYTFQPTESFVLTEIPGEMRTAFVGDIVRGHFERDSGPPSILRNVRVEVEEILYFEDLRRPLVGEHPTDEGRVEYVLFGAGDEFFLSHRISLHGTQNADDDNAFHQIFRVSPEIAAAFRFSVDRSVIDVRMSSADATGAGRLPVVGGTFEAVLMGLVSGNEATLPVTLELGPEHYLEVLF